ncbi:nuclear transport factor 2 family protein [Gemmatimonadota bacterium]
MKKAFLFVMLLWVGPLDAAAQDLAPEDAVGATVKSFFDALREKDEEGIRNALAPGARLMGIRTVEGRPTLQTTDFEDFIPRVVGSEARMDERNWDVQIEVKGDLANVWQRFNMFINGELSHCGTEVIHLFRFPEGWKILHLSETLTSEGCEAENTPGQG